MGRLTSTSTLFDLIHDFFRIYLPNQRNSPSNTIKAYRAAMTNYLDVACKNSGKELKKLDFDIFDPKYTELFYFWMKDDKKYSPSTINQKTAGVKEFISYACMRMPELIKYTKAFSMLPRVKTDTWASVDYMTEDAVNALFRQPDVSTKEGLRDAFYLVLIYDTAARVDEMMKIKIRDIKTGKTPTVKLHGKGSKIRTVPLMQNTMTYYEKYMKVFHEGENELSNKPLFYTKRKGIITPMSDDNVRRFMKKYAGMARKECISVPENVHPHLWRHSRAMHLYQHGMDLTLLSQWLGHSGLTVTLVYAHADTEHKREAISKAMDNTSLVTPDTSLFTVSDEELLKRLCGLK